MKVTGVRTVLVTAPWTGDPFWLPGEMFERTAALVVVDTDEGLSGVGETIMGYFCAEVVTPLDRLLRRLLSTLDLDPTPARGHVSRAVPALALVGPGRSSGCPCCRGSRWRSGTSPARRPVDPVTSSSVGRPTIGCRCTRRAAPEPGRSSRPSRRRSATPRWAFAGSRSGRASRAGRAASRRRRARHRTERGTRGAPPSESPTSARSSGRCGRRSGPDIELATDCHAVQVREPWSRKTALDLARALEPFDLLFMEEPLRYDDPEGYAELRRATRVPIAGGECLTGVDEFRRYLDLDALDYVQPDATHVGGIGGDPRGRADGGEPPCRADRPHRRRDRPRVHGQSPRRVREPELAVRRVHAGARQRPLGTS